MAIYLNGKLIAGGTVTNNKVTSVSEAVLVNQADLVQKANNVNIVIDENTPSPTINFTSEDNSVAINVNNANNVNNVNTVQSAGTVGEYTGEIIYLKQGSSSDPSDWNTDKIYIQPSTVIIGLWIYWYDSNKDVWYRYILSNESQIGHLEQGQNQYYDNIDDDWKEVTE